MIDKIDEAYEAYLKITKKSDTVFTNIQFCSYLKLKSTYVRWAIFANEKNFKKYAYMSKRKFTDERINHLLTPHAETLYQTAIIKDGWWAPKYYLINHFLLVLLPVVLSLFYDRFKDSLK